MLTSPAGVDFSRLFQTFDIFARRSVIAAISGGSDSTALLLLLKDHLDRPGCTTRLIAVTIDHRLREGSTAEALDVSQLCARLGIEHRILTWDGPKPSTGLPAAARMARYTLLAQAARDADTDLVLTGHTADDQAETVLMRQARDGGRGLAGIAPATLFDGSVWIGRPLLAARRETLRDCLRKRGIGWVDDPTNSDPSYERPRVRAELGTRGDERVEAPLALAAKASVEREELGAAAAGLIDHFASLVAPGLVRIDPAFVDAGPASVYALRILLAIIGGREHLPDEGRSTALLERVCAKKPFRGVLSRTLVDSRKAGIFLLREARGLPPPDAADGAIWDGRFSISTPPVGWPQSEARAPLSTVGETIPGSLVDAASSTMPCAAAPRPPAGTLSVAGDGERNEAPTPPSPGFSRRGKKGGEQRDTWSSSLVITPILAPWHRFLPSFDLAPARAAARLFGVAEIPAPPFPGHNGRKA